jgi:hypothetical protein
VGVHTQVIDMVGTDRIDVEDLEPQGDGAVIVLSRMVLQGGALTHQVIEHHVFRDGFLWRQMVWFDREEGRREIGG